MSPTLEFPLKGRKEEGRREGEREEEKKEGNCFVSISIEYYKWTTPSFLLLIELVKHFIETWAWSIQDESFQNDMITL